MEEVGWAVGEVVGHSSMRSAARTSSVVADVVPLLGTGGKIGSLLCGAADTA